MADLEPNNPQDSEMSESTNNNKPPVGEASMSDDEDCQMSISSGGECSPVAETSAVNRDKQMTNTTDQNVIILATSKTVEKLAKWLIKRIPRDVSHYEAIVEAHPGETLTEDFLCKVTAEVALLRPDQYIMVTQKKTEEDEDAPGVTDSEAEVDEELLCANCGAKERRSIKFLSCEICRMVKYCGKECQKAHWEEHKPLCTRKGVKKSEGNVSFGPWMEV